MKDKTSYIKLGLNNSITDLNLIRDTYNEYALGGYLGWVREANNHPISYDEEGYLTDLITGEKGTMLLPELIIHPDAVTQKSRQEAKDRIINRWISHSEINPITGKPQVIGLEEVYPEFDLLTLSPIFKSGISKANKLYNNYLDLQALRKFNLRYDYNLIKPKTSIIFNDDKLDKVFNHTVNVHNTFARGVDPYEAIKFGRFPKDSNIEKVAEYSLTHIPAPTATNNAGLLPNEAALYTSNSLGLVERYTNGNGYIGILRRPIKTGLKTRRLFLADNDFRFNPIPDNPFSVTTDVPRGFKKWTNKTNSTTKSSKRRYGNRVPKYELTPEYEFLVRANAGSFPIPTNNMSDNNFRHYLFVGNEGELPLKLLRKYPVTSSKSMSDFDFTSVGFSHKK